MDNPLISVIVPVYNVEDCLENTLRSLQNQTYKAIEVLLVDDGSSDSSGMICDSWASSDERFKVIHKANGGLSSARNTGINEASGAYISFVDGDDLLSPKAIEALYGGIVRTNSSLCVGALRKLKGGTKTYVNDEPVVYEAISTQTCLERLLFCNGISASACGKLYRADIWRELRFPEGSYYEDIATIPMSIAACDCVASTNYACYGYVTRRGSITGSSTITKKKLDDARSELTKLKCFVSDSKLASSDAIDHFVSFALLRIHRYIVNTDILPKDEIRKLTVKIRKEACRWRFDNRLRTVNRARFFIFSISPKLYESVFKAYASVSKLNVA